MTPCRPVAYEICVRQADGTLYEGWADRRWQAQDMCWQHFWHYVVDFGSLIDQPIRIEFRALDSAPPKWTQV